MQNGVIITGGAKRVGAAIALYFAKNGYDVALHYNKSKNEAKNLKKQIEEQGVNCEIFSCDLGSTSEIQTLIENIYKKMPNCNILVNNASVFERCEFLETDEALFDRQFDINFKAPFFLSKSFAKIFRDNSDACIVNIIDTDIVRNQVSHFAYLLSKKTLADFTCMAAIALGSDIRVNAVCPGSMLPSGENYAGYEEKVKNMVPLKLQPSLDELAEAVLWISKQRSITGQIINVDGGKHVI